MSTDPLGRIKCDYSLQCRMWDHNDPRGRQNMEEYRILIIRGIRETAPRNQNTHTTFAEQQKKP